MLTETQDFLMLHDFPDLRRLELARLREVSPAGLDAVWKLKISRALGLDVSFDALDASFAPPQRYRQTD